MSGKSPTPKTKEMQITSLLHATEAEVTGMLTFHPKRKHEIASYQFVVTEETFTEIEKYFMDDGTLTVRFSEVDGQSAMVDLDKIEVIRFVPAGVGA